MASKKDLQQGIAQLSQSLGLKRQNGTGMRIANTFVLPEYSDKPSLLIKLDSLYESPKQWNFYDPVDKVKFKELKKSIAQKGILSPIILWKCEYDVFADYYSDSVFQYSFKGTEYMILAGHNRAKAVMELYEETGDLKYLSIPAFVYNVDELDTNTAKDIIVDTNYIQRQLTIREKVLSVAWKYAQYEKEGNDGLIRAKVAKDLDMGEASVQRYYSVSKLLEPLQYLLYNKKLKIINTASMGCLPKNLQQYLVDNYLDRINNKVTAAIAKATSIEDIDNIFNGKEVVAATHITMTYKIPVEFAEKFKEYVEIWLKENVEK